MERPICSSCKKRLNTVGATKFKCPSCRKVEIVRCSSCRERAVRYSCAECGFSGPN